MLAVDRIRNITEVRKTKSGPEKELGDLQFMDKETFTQYMKAVTKAIDEGRINKAGCSSCCMYSGGGIGTRKKPLPITELVPLLYAVP
jgi:hypothetical protein